MGKILLEVFQLWPFIVQSVVAVEGVAANETGATKKQIVIDSTVAAAKSFENVPDSVVSMISKEIDTVVTVLNASGIFKHKTSAAPVAAAA